VLVRVYISAKPSVHRQTDNDGHLQQDGDKNEIKYSTLGSSMQQRR